MRRGPDLELIGVSARVPDTITPLQIGVRGMFGGKVFELIGRVRWQWRDEAKLVGGGWSEWLALSADGSAGWLAEAMGRYTMLTGIEPLPDDDIVRRVGAGEPIVADMLVELAGTSYRTIDARTAEVVGSEGELPFAAPAGETVFGVDLANAGGGRASVQRHGDVVTAWRGSAVKLRALQPRGLRRLDGWRQPGWAA
ncbi:DUF4178 domain-containing protein [Sandarakinorhabdus sp. DWP1-3-1]|uniref:DUF4178 domain-containing protein n=1 Tax=Sandarakinorhabdus sp. DWP1-3-1 TaxID=2804627 RepID=UPI003CEEDC3C